MGRQIKSKKNRKKKEIPPPTRVDLGITYGILSIWGFLLIFGIISLLSPPWLEKISEKGRKYDASVSRRIAHKYQAMRKYEQAIHHYEKAIEVHPEYNEAIQDLATVYLEMGDYDKGITTLQEALKQIGDGDSHLIYYNLGICYQQLGKFDQAVEAYQKSLVVLPRPVTYYQLSKIYVSQQNWKEAIVSFQHHIDYISQMKSYYQSMIDRGFYQLEDYEDPDVQEALQNLKTKPLTEDDLKHYDPLIFHYFMDTNEQLVDLYYNLGLTYFYDGDLPHAIEYYQKTLELNPNYEAAQVNLKKTRDMYQSDL